MTYREILRWFADEFSPYAHYSIHNFARLGAVKFGKQIGDWFEPTTVSEAIRLLVQQHSPEGMKVYVAKDGIIYRDEVQQLCIVQPADGPAHQSPREGPDEDEDSLETSSEMQQSHSLPASSDGELMSSAGLESEASSPEGTFGKLVSLFYSTTVTFFLRI